MNLDLSDIAAKLVGDKRRWKDYRARASTRSPSGIGRPRGASSATS